MGGGSVVLNIALVEVQIDQRGLSTTLSDDLSQQFLTDQIASRIGAADYITAYLPSLPQDVERYWELECDK